MRPGPTSAQATMKVKCAECGAVEGYAGDLMGFALHCAKCGRARLRRGAGRKTPIECPGCGMIEVCADDPLGLAFRCAKCRSALQASLRLSTGCYNAALQRRGGVVQRRT